jgi:hypothetical protein
MMAFLPMVDWFRVSAAAITIPFVDPRQGVYVFAVVIIRHNTLFVYFVVGILCSQPIDEFATLALCKTALDYF